MRLLAFSILLLASQPGLTSENLDTRKMGMLEAIRTDFAETVSYTGIAAPSEKVMDAMARVKRELYVPEDRQAMAYVNRAMSIGYGQTISQPFIVALMTELLDVDPGDTVLEIGTGSGYQAAILGELASSVYTIEIVPELAALATERLARHGYDNIHVREGNGWLGWPEAGPYDAIIVTAAGPEISPHLIEQLKPGGRMAVPLGAYHGAQMLTLIIKSEDGTLEESDVLPVVFVPLTGEQGD